MPKSRSSQRLGGLSTPHLADACLRVGAPVRCAPSALVALSKGMRCAGRVLPARHVGSVDVFLEAMERALPGDVLVIDNDGRLDEGCVGDLVTLEAQKSGLGGIVVWGVHRDSDEVADIGLPLFSLGAMPTGPQRLDPSSPDRLDWARVGPWVVTTQDQVVCDQDGVIFLPGVRLSEIITAAEGIREIERQHAARMRAGTSFRQQTRFAEYLAVRAGNPAYSFREHIRKIGGAIEE